ncbi:MAG: Mpv17/PMP22 family protein [Bacillota bacterium]
MKKGDIIWLGTLGLIVLFLIVPTTHEIFISLTQNYSYLMGFVKVFILATMGELLALRIVTNEWKKPVGLLYRAIIWGFLGMSFVLIFDIFAGGVKLSMEKGLLPGNSVFAFAFFTSSLMNIAFAPVMMAFHRITDTYIDLSYGKLSNISSVKLADVVRNIDWQGFISFVVIKTIPLFWIPAHTVTFLLPPEYRVLLASFLSIALGAILAFAKKTNTKTKHIQA